MKTARLLAYAAAAATLSGLLLGGVDEAPGCFAAVALVFAFAMPSLFRG